MQPNEHVPKQRGRFITDQMKVYPDQPPPAAPDSTTEALAHTGPSAPKHRTSSVSASSEAPIDASAPGTIQARPRDRNTLVVISDTAPAPRYSSTGHCRLLNKDSCRASVFPSISPMS